MTSLGSITVHSSRQQCCHNLQPEQGGQECLLILILDTRWRKREEEEVAEGKEKRESEPSLHSLNLLQHGAPCNCLLRNSLATGILTCLSFNRVNRNMISVSDVVSAASSDDGEEHSVETNLDCDDVDADVKLMPKAATQDVMQPGTDEGVPLVINIAPESEARDEVDGDAIEDNNIDERENNLSNKTSDTKKKNSKHKTRKSRKNSRTKGGIDAKDVIITLNKNITSARHHKTQVTDHNTLISPYVDGVIDNLIYRCDPLFEADYEATCLELLQQDVGNEEHTDKDYDTNEDNEVQSKIDRILSLAELHGVTSEKDDVHNYNKFELNGLSALVNQKREIDDLVVSKGLVDAELQETKEKLSDAIDTMKELHQSNDELHVNLQTMETRLEQKNKTTEYAARKEQEMSQNYMHDLDIAQSTIERLKKERHNDLANHRELMADIKFTLKEETQHNEQLKEDFLLLKQQLVAERSKRMSIEELMHAKDNQNEMLRSELHQKERYCVELEQTMRMTKKGAKKDFKELQKINEDLSYKLLSSKEKLKRSRRERNELDFRLERLNISLRVEANTRAKFEEDEYESNLELEGGIDDDVFLTRQSRRMERMKSIMS